MKIRRGVTPAEGECQFGFRLTALEASGGAAQLGAQVPELTVNRDSAAGSNCIQKGLAISPQETRSARRVSFAEVVETALFGI
jgi:hypothetical protein